MTQAGEAAPAQRASAGNAPVRFRHSAGRAARWLAGGAIALAATHAHGQGYEPGGASLPLSVPGAAGAVAVAPGTVAQNPQTTGNEFVPFIGIDETLTSNANFDRVRNEKKADLVTQITPGFRVAQFGAHSSLTGTVNVPMLFYARTGGDNNRVLPEISLAANLNTLDRHFVLDSGIEVHREFLTPLGARPTSATANSLNEYSSGTYRITPILQGDTPGQWHYDLRDSNTWTNIQGAPGSLDDAYTNDARARLSKDPAPLGGGVEYQRTKVQFKSEQSPPLTTEIFRARGEWAPAPDLRLSASGGHENNKYSFATYSDAIYGVGARWRPSERTSVDAAWEHRFFGSSWHVSLDHRTPLTVWSVQSSRDVTTYPQQLANIGAGTNVSQLLNNLLLSRIPDPAARQQAIDNLIRLYGLPSTITAPVQLYSQQARLVTDTRVVAGFLGVRNTVYFSIYRNRDQAVVQAGEAAGTTLPFDDVTQTGANMTWSTRLSSIMTLTGILDYVHAKGNSSSPPASTDNGTASLTVSTPISGYTDFHYGIRYQYTRGNIGVNADEAAVYAGIIHRFR
jgi:uncharacterized protein (PEP-CTERM system associated)